MDISLKLTSYPKRKLTRSNALMKMRGDVERQRNNKGREPYSTVNDADFVWAKPSPTQSQVLHAGKPVKVETHNYADEPVFVPAFQVKRRKPRSKPSPSYPKHGW